MMKPSPFTKYFVQHNHLVESCFKEWYFHPGMTFNSMDKWWGDLKKRPKHHEGLDLCYYRDNNDDIHPVALASKIPAMYAGDVVGIIDDFLGQSVILEHEERFCTIYAHTHPRDGLAKGDRVNQGEVLAFVADTKRSKSGIAPHVHITAAWVKGDVSYERLEWPTLSEEPYLELVDPFPYI